MHDHTSLVLLKKNWEKGEIPKTWKKAVTVLIYKSGETDIPSNFRPITLETVPLKNIYFDSEKQDV